MADLYEGQPDARQAGDITPSRFRPRYRQLTDAEKAVHDAIKAKAAELELLFDQARDLRFPLLPAEALLTEHHDGPLVLSAAMIGQLEPAVEYFSDGMKSLELAVMWTVKGLTS